MKLSLPESLKAFDEQQVASGKYANAEQYLGALIEAAEKACVLGSRKTHALTLVGAPPKQQVLDFMVVREGLEPSTSAL